MKNQIRDHNSDSLKINNGISFVIETFMKVNNGGIDFGGKKGEKELKISKERRVIKSPFTSSVRIPVRKRKRISSCKPISMNFEISAMVRWDQK